MIPVNEPLLDGNEKKYLNECIDTGWISSEGPFVKKFEDQFSSTVGRKFGIAVANGSVALDAAVTALKIGKGDEVIMPTFTIISCAAAIVRTGAVPVLVDCDPLTWNMDVDLIEARITSKTKAIMVVHIYGLPVEMDPVLALAEKYGLRIIEDAAEAHGLNYRGQRTEVGSHPGEMRSAVVNEFHRAGRSEGRGQKAEGAPVKYASLSSYEFHPSTISRSYGTGGVKRSEGKPCGSFGDISTFSFYPNKLITTGEGGMIVTNNEELAERCRSLRNLCFQPQKRFVHEELGWNFRFTNLQAAVGLAQLEKLDEHIKQKRRMGELYTKLLTGIPELQLPLPKTDYAENIYWVYGIVLKDQVPFDAEEAMRRLKDKGIGTRPFFWPMHKQPVFMKMGLFNGEQYPVAERIARRGFYIPSGLGLGEEQINYVAESLKNIERNE